jgi:hypothetical protein
MTGARPQRGGRWSGSQLAALMAAALAVTLAVAGCGEDEPTPADVGAGVVRANDALAAGDPGAGLGEYEATLAAAAELEDEAAGATLTRALEEARGAAEAVAAGGERLAAAREAVAGPDRYEPALAEAAAELRREAAALSRAAAALTGANADVGAALGADAPAELRGQASELRSATAELERELRDAAARAARLAVPHPYGPLRPDGIGPVDFGDPAAAAKRAFGLPGRDEEIGFGVGPPPRLDWIYRAEPGFRLVFDATLGTLAGYSCRGSCSLEAESGIGVGDRFSAVEREYGGRLREYPIGLGSVYLPAGRGDGFPAMIFAREFGGGRVADISAFETLAGPAGE